LFSLTFSSLYIGFPNQAFFNCSVSKIQTHGTPTMPRAETLIASQTNHDQRRRKSRAGRLRPSRSASRGGAALQRRWVPRRHCLRAGRLRRRRNPLPPRRGQNCRVPREPRRPIAVHRLRRVSRLRGPGSAASLLRRRWSQRYRELRGIGGRGSVRSTDSSVSGRSGTTSHSEF